MGSKNFINIVKATHISIAFFTYTPCLLGSDATPASKPTLTVKARSGSGEEEELYTPVPALKREDVLAASAALVCLVKSHTNSMRKALKPSTPDYASYGAELYALQKYFNESIAHRLSPQIKSDLYDKYGTIPTVYFEISHLFDPRVIVKKGHPVVQGFHHDPDKKIQSKGVIKYEKSQTYPDESYKVLISIPTSSSSAVISGYKTFFPSEWNRKQVLKNIGKALENAKKADLDEKDDEHVFLGVIPGITPLPIIIRIRFLDGNPVITTMYPEH